MEKEKERKNKAPLDEEFGGSVYKTEWIGRWELGYRGVRRIRYGVVGIVVVGEDCVVRNGE